MMTGTSGRRAFALGKSSRPLIPGMLMSESIKISDTPAASPMRSRAADAEGKLHGEPASAQVTPEVLPKQGLNVRLVVDHENKQTHARPFDLL